MQKVGNHWLDKRILLQRRILVSHELHLSTPVCCCKEGKHKQNHKSKMRSNCSMVLSTGKTWTRTLHHTCILLVGEARTSLGQHRTESLLITEMSEQAWGTWTGEDIRMASVCSAPCPPELWTPARTHTVAPESNLLQGSTLVPFYLTGISLLLLVTAASCPLAARLRRVWLCLLATG